MRERIYIHAHTHTHTQTHRQPDRQTDRHTHTHTHTHSHTYTHSDGSYMLGPGSSIVQRYGFVVVGLALWVWALILLS
jgi:ABC-type nickel/cobalt efflux system permease component RcnA